MPHFYADRWFTFLTAMFLLASISHARQDDSKDDGQEKKLPTISEKVEQLERNDGFFAWYWDPAQGKILLEIDNPGQEFLYVHSLATGLGSNPVGLDRGQLGSDKVVRFELVGPKALLIERNLRYRALTDNEPEKRSVRQSFAESVIWGGDIVARDDDGRCLVDLTSLLMNDVHGVVETLARTDQGAYTLDGTRSAVFLPRCKAFPLNTEFEATLTFTTSKPGPLVSQTAPTAQSISLRQHHSLIQLPDDRYRPREYDARCPSMSIAFSDYASPIDQPLQKRWILRHRLQKKNPGTVSEPVEPIIYYVDPGAPPMIRDALIEGASWWDQAFAAAGFRNAFQVQVLPADADPLDVRYNVIQWVHRSTRGWSYGGSVIDPRSGEIIKGHVTLGSLRVRQDHLLIEGLGSGAVAAVNPNRRCECCGIGMTASDNALAQVAERTDPVDVALARIRQLSAHEVGHTLGFVHNFAASTYGDRASVMDYPAPRIKLAPQNRLDFSDAYAVGIGEWDKVSVIFAYGEFEQGEQEQVKLNQVLDTAAEQGMIFISDADARPAGAAHPLANLWDNGSDPVEEFHHVMNVRRAALQRFNASQLPADLDAAELEQYLVPIYLHHRYQLNAVGKLIGGYYYNYGPASNPETRPVAVDLAVQIEAIKALYKAISPEELSLGAGLFEQIGVKPYRQPRDQERFEGLTGRTFDPYAPARVAIDLATDEIFQPDRLARFVHQTIDQDEFKAQFLLEGLINMAWEWSDQADSKQTLLLTQLIRENVVNKLIALAENQRATVQVRSAAMGALSIAQSRGSEIREDLDITEANFRTQIVRRINQFLLQPYKNAPDPAKTTVPPGSPIGNGN